MFDHMEDPVEIPDAEKKAGQPEIENESPWAVKWNQQEQRKKAHKRKPGELKTREDRHAQSCCENDQKENPAPFRNGERNES